MQWSTPKPIPLCQVRALVRLWCEKPMVLSDLSVFSPLETMKFSACMRYIWHTTSAYRDRCLTFRCCFTRATKLAPEGRSHTHKPVPCERPNPNNMYRIELWIRVRMVTIGHLSFTAQIESLKQTNRELCGGHTFCFALLTSSLCVRLQAALLAGVKWIDVNEFCYHRLRLR